MARTTGKPKFDPGYAPAGYRARQALGADCACEVCHLHPSIGKRPGTCADFPCMADERPDRAHFVYFVRIKGPGTFEAWWRSWSATKGAKRLLECMEYEEALAVARDIWQSMRRTQNGKARK